GIVSPLLANVYLHEMDQYMERYTGLTKEEKTQRRQEGSANFVYVRYADDFVVLCNGTRKEAEQMREELCTFLSTELGLRLWREKARITHLNDGFDFLGFKIRRSMGAKGMTTKVLISDKGMEKHLGKLLEATAPGTHKDSLVPKLKAINRIIAGWCRYYQYTSKAATQFAELTHRTFWLVAHWLGRKYQLTMPNVMKRFYKDGTLGSEEVTLVRHSAFPILRYKGRFLKPNPYTTQAAI